MNDVFEMEMNFRVRLAKVLSDAQGRRKDELSVIATALWFAKAKSQSKCETPYAMERFFEPKAFGKNREGDLYHRNKWAKYAVGLHQPSVALIEQVEEQAPGTANIIKHPLWEILRHPHKVTAQRGELIGRLSTQVQQVLRREERLHDATGLCREITRRQLQMLEHRAGLDALAALALFTAEALMEGKHQAAFEMCNSLYRVLLILCTMTPFDKFSAELYEILHMRLLSRVEHDGLGFGSTPSEFAESAYLLLVQVLALEDANQIGWRHQETINACVDLLDGKYGFDVRFALAPLYVAVSHGNAPNQAAIDAAERSQKRQAWGRKVLRSGKVERFAPDNIF